MDFKDFEVSVQNDIIELLNEHVATSAEIIRDDKCLLPMLMIKGEDSDSNQLVCLQPADGNIDVDKAYCFVLQKLKALPFTYALFSYSTQVGLATGGISDAIKTVIFTSQGAAVSFYTPYSLKGVFRKTLTLEKSMLGEIEENALNR